MEHVSNPWDSAIAAGLYDAMHHEIDDVPVLLALAKEAGGPILEIGCGTGRCLLPMIRAGYDTVGIDNSDHMLNRLRTKLETEVDEFRHRATILLDDGIDFELPLSFGLTYLAADAFTHVLKKAGQESLVGNVFKHLRPGGLLVIDVFNPTPSFLVASSERYLRVSRVEVIEERLFLDYCAQLTGMRTTYRGPRDSYQIEWAQRYSFRYELEHLIEKAGFELYRLWGDYTGTCFGQATERLFIVARKPREAEHVPPLQMKAIMSLSN